MTPDKRVEEIAQTLIDIGVEIDTHQDGDAFIKTFTFNEAQLEAFLTQYHQDLMSELVEKWGRDCQHNWTPCPGVVCTSDLHTHHCTVCHKHAFQPKPLSNLSK